MKKAVETYSVYLEQDFTDSTSSSIRRTFEYLQDKPIPEDIIEESAEILGTWIQFVIDEEILKEVKKELSEGKLTKEQFLELANNLGLSPEGESK